MRIWQPIKWVVALPALAIGVFGFMLMMLGVGCFTVAKYMILMVED
jgi:hypothetical protein